jgi:hypothetical protein
MTPRAIVRKSTAGEPTELVSFGEAGNLVVVPLTSSQARRLAADLLNADLMDELKALGDGQQS